MTYLHDPFDDDDDDEQCLIQHALLYSALKPFFAMHWNRNLNLFDIW